MSENLDKILKLENKLESLMEDGIDTTDTKCEKVVLQIAKLLDKISNYELLYLLNESDCISQVIDITAYFKKYKLNKKEVKENNSFMEEFKKLSSFVEEIREKAICEEEYLYICYKCDVDNVAAYFLKHMSNSDIMELSNNSTDWDYKLFLFGNLKEQISFCPHSITDSTDPS